MVRSCHDVNCVKLAKKRQLKKTFNDIYYGSRIQKRLKPLGRSKSETLFNSLFIAGQGAQYLGMFRDLMISTSEKSKPFMTARSYVSYDIRTLDREEAKPDQIT